MMKGHADEVENEGQFISIMQSFGQSFLQPDISIFKQNLETLESLNSKWKLYHKVRELRMVHLKEVVRGEGYRPKCAAVLIKKV